MAAFGGFRNMVNMSKPSNMPNMTSNMAPNMSTNMPPNMSSDISDMPPVNTNMMGGFVTLS